MKPTLSPGEVHKRYVQTLAAFAATVPDAALRARLDREADGFFRSVALGVWNHDGGSPAPGYVEYYNAIYHPGAPVPKCLYWELASEVARYPGFTPPEFFRRMRELDRERGGGLSRRFVDVFSLMALLFASADGTVSDGEAAFVNSSADALSQLCRQDGLPGGEEALDARQFVPAASAPAEEKPEAEPEPSLEELLAELDGLCGLERVKADVKSLINLVKVRKLRQEKGLPAPALSLHLVFLGNPGTGKTTVARLLAGLYHTIGVLSKGQLVEVDRSGLVAGFVGQTALKTQKVIDSAAGGVLFIDEAYALTSHAGQNDFGQEAVEVLLKNMEDRRDDLVVIVAGYTGPMEEFIHSNPGLESRFNKYFFFDDYTGEELLEIFRSMCGKNGYTLSEGAERYAREVLEGMYRERDENFGNARDARNFFERGVACQADRVAALETVDQQTLMELTEEDLRKAAEK